ncbi:SpoIID/LytB domain-containing protein [bacterium]|nr:SpoIID/LytB domain-containing protein [bacterium]
MILTFSNFCVSGRISGRFLGMLSVLLAFSLSTTAGAQERLINIKVAQYENYLDFSCPHGAAWNIGQNSGSILGNDKCSLSGVIEKKAVKRYHVIVASVSMREPIVIFKIVREWETLKHPVNTLIIGKPLFGLDDRTLLNDGREALIEVGVFPDFQSAQALVDKLASEGKSSWIFVEVVSLSKGKITLKVNSQEVGFGENLLLAPKENVMLRKVEHGMGYPWHGFADRNYRGTMVFQWGAQDAIDCILKTQLERVLAGVVPSEISSKAEIGALQAQATAARGEILGKLGIRHVNEGFDTCSEQHCQVFAGETSETAVIAAKISPTRGLVLTKPAGGIVDAVYSSNCGGHGEANHLVWTTPPDPILNGVWDSENAPNLDLSEEEQAGVFIDNPPNCYCKDPLVEGGDKFRWRKNISPAEWNLIETKLGVGKIKKITDIARGFSGRIYRLTFVGNQGSKTLMKELNIRKLFGGLRSSCFVSTWNHDSEGFISGGSLSGAGFGHGVGMCQTGAQSLAKKGWTFERILSHYFPGGILKKWY